MMSPLPSVLELSPQPVTDVPPVRWIAPPKNGQQCPFTGLSHAYVYTKLLKSFSDCFVHLSLRMRGEEKGTRLMFVPSLHRLLVATGPELDDKARAGLKSRRFAAVDHDLVPARWSRVPPNGMRCEFTGLSHGGVYELLERAGKQILVAQLRMPDECRATRLVWLPSLHQYLLGLAKSQAGLDQVAA